MSEVITEQNQKVEDTNMNYITYLFNISFFNIIFANPAAWQDDPSGGSPMPIWLIVIGVFLLYFMFWGEK